MPAPALTPEEEFDLFGPPDDRNPFVGAASPAAKASASAPLPGTTYVGPQVAVGLDQNLVVEKSAGDVPEPSSHAKHGEIGWNEKRELGRKKGPKSSQLSKQKLGPPLIRLVEAAIRLEAPTCTGGNRAEKYLAW